MGINRFENGAWKEINDLRRFRNGSWQTAELKRYNGEAWETLWPCHYSGTASYPLTGYVVTRRQIDPVQVDKDYLVTGNSGTGLNSLYDSLLFFDLEQIRSDLAGAQITKAALKLKRVADYNEGTQDITYVKVGCALSGADPLRTDNTWDRSFTLLVDSRKEFTRGETKSLDIDTLGVGALIDGTADCLCLPTTSDLSYSNRGYAYYDPKETVLTVSYHI